MDNERWNHLDRLLQSALDRPLAERDVFLQRACDGDEQLARDVRSLLAAHDGADSFLAAPAIDLAARELARERSDDGGDDPLIGQTLSHYRIVGKLGGGGMGVIYKAEDSRLHRPVALKFVSGDLAGDADALSRFQREARTASALSHPHICTIYDIGEQDGRSFIAMEYLEGATLRDRLAAGPLGRDTVVRLGIQIADALEAAHSAGIIHRDIKPANIFVGPRDRVKVLDFGLAKMRQAGTPQPVVTSVAGTRGGVVMGTPAYMAPEQARGEAADHRADIWSLGLVLYEMAQGVRPAPAVRLRVEDFPELERIISRCLETHRDRRYQHAADLRTDLERLARGPDSAPAGRDGERSTTRGRRTVLATSAAALALATAGYFFYPRQASALTDKDTIVLAEFINKTGDPVFDDTLRQGLAVQLQQSPFLSLVSDQRILGTLALMNRPANARLTADIARGVCVRTASAAVLEGSIAMLGSQYVLGLRATHCTTGDILADEQAQAARKEDVLDTLSQIATRFRTRVGESLATIEKHSMPLAAATTPSLDAWQAFSTGSDLTVFAWERRLPHYQRAVAIDPEFASAHALIGFGYSSIGESKLGRQSLLKAYQLRHRASDVERLNIETLYDRDFTGNLERERQTLETWAASYPRDPRPRSLMAGLALTGTGQHELALAKAEEAITLDPDLTPAYGSRAFNQLYLNRLDDALLTVNRARERNLESGSFGLIRYHVAFLKGDEAERTRLAAAARSPGLHDIIAHLEALAVARSGRLRDARRMSALPVEIAQQSNRRERAGLFKGATAVWEAFYGNAAAAKQSATEALALGRGRNVDYAAAFALALAGYLPQSRALADDLAREFPDDTFVQFMYLPTLRALYSLNTGDAAAAIHELQTASRYDLATNGVGFGGRFGAFYPIYVRGLAYLAARRPAEAAGEFQRILDHRGVVLVDPMDAMARLQLARALVLAGDETKAKGAYSDLLTLWKNADQAIPVVKKAREEYARLP